MAAALSWRSQDATLALSGELDRASLLPLWQQREALLVDKTTLDVSGLERVDSSGLALLVHFCRHLTQGGATPRVIGVTDRLRTLIALYNLADIIPVAQAE